MRDRLESLERLARLRESGLLTPEELEAEKRRILGACEGQDAGVSPLRSDSPSRLVLAREAVRRRPWIFGAIAGGAVLTTCLVVIVLTGPQLQIEPSGQPTNETAVDRPDETNASGLANFDEVLAGGVANCGFADTVIAGFTSLQSASSEPGSEPFRLPDFDAPLELRRASLPQGENGGEALLLEAATVGRWRGLRVDRLRVTTWGSGGPVTLQVRFVETPQRVRDTLNAAGFSLDPPGQLKHVRAEQQNYVVALEPVGQGAALTCARPAARPS